MKFIIQTILAIGLLVFAISLHAQTNGTNGQVQKLSPAMDSIMKLINEKMIINKALIDSAMKAVTLGMQPEKARLTVKEWEMYFDAFEYFKGTLIAVWLEENRKKKPK